MAHETLDHAIDPPRWTTLIVVAGIITAVCVAVVVAYPPDNSATWFSGLQAWFSGLAFAGVILAILLQRTDLRLQRHELELTRQELAGQKDALKAQNLTFQKQSFEDTYFQLLGLLGDIVNATRSRGGAAGRASFAAFYAELRDKYEHRVRANPNKNDHEQLVQSYMEFYSDRQGDVGHFFRTLYNIVKWVDRSNVTDKSFYQSDKGPAFE